MSSHHYTDTLTLEDHDGCLERGSLGKLPFSRLGMAGGALGNILEVDPILLLTSCGGSGLVYLPHFR